MAENVLLKRNIFQRLLGLCATKEPSDKGCWQYEDSKLTVDLSRAPELSSPYGAIRIESANIPKRVLVVKGEDGQYYAFINECAHGKRRMDPLPGSQKIQCCSVGKSTYDYKGKRIAGSAKNDVITLPVILENGKLLITL